MKECRGRQDHKINIVLGYISHTIHLQKKSKIMISVTILDPMLGSSWDFKECIT